MKKRLTSLDIFPGYLKGKANTKGWALCIGAGVSLPVFPNWKDLVVDLIKKDTNLKDVNSITEIITSFNLDSLIQASSNILGMDEKLFAQLLSNELYEFIKLKTTKEEWDSVCNIFTSVRANLTKDHDWINFINVRDRLFKSTTSYSLAKVIIDSYNKNLAPDAILSFNAEPLLYSLITSFAREPFIGKIKKAKEVKEIVDLITVSISSQCKGRIPYYFCHGALLSDLTTKNDIRLRSTSKLVFSESSYLQIANTSFSWQSTNFLSVCSKSTVIFLGVSLTDPNMRKWLTWIQTERSNDISDKKDSTQHFWITKKPNHEDTMRWTEAAVFHLGIRVIWIDDWNETENVLRNLIGV